MAKKILIDADTQLYVKKKKAYLFEISQFVYISEDINYTAEDTIDVTEHEDEHIEYVIGEHGGNAEIMQDIALAIFKEKAESGEYSPN